MKLASVKVAGPHPILGVASGMKLVVTIPALNEEKTIAQVIAGVPRNIPGVDETEVIVMNDGSTDRTAEVRSGPGRSLLTSLAGRVWDMSFEPAWSAPCGAAPTSSSTSTAMDSSTPATSPSLSNPCSKITPTLPPVPDSLTQR